MSEATTAGSGGSGGSGGVNAATAGTGNVAGTTVTTGDLGPGNSGCQCLLSGPGSERPQSGVVIAALAMAGLVRRRRVRRAAHES